MAHDTEVCEFAADSVGTLNEAELDSVRGGQKVREARAETETALLP